MARASIIWCICLAFHSALGQESFLLAGRVIDTAGVGLARATVEYIAPSDTMNVLSGDDGRFVFPRVKDRNFELMVTMKGYFPYAKSLDLPSGKAVYRIPSIVLRTDYLDLDPVTVSYPRPITFTEDTVSYHAAAFPVRDGSEVEDILKRLPGIEVDMDGNVIVEGKKLEKVLVNGKEFFGGDVLLAIRNLPADVVDKLQVIDDYGDKARLTGIKSGDPAKVLNIVLKADKRNGRFGHAQAGAGNDDKYAGEAFANRFQGNRQTSASAGASNNNPAGPDPAGNGALSYADQWDPYWSGGLNASLGGDNPQTRNALTQQTYYPGQQLDLDQTIRIMARNRNEGGGGIITFKPDEHSTFRLSPSAGGQQASQQSLIEAATLEQDTDFTKMTQDTSITGTTTKTWNAGTDLYYERTLPGSKRRFRVQGNIRYTDSRQFTNELSNSSIVSDSQPSYSLLHYLVANHTSGLNMNFQSGYFFPLGLRAFLETGYNLQSVYSRADRETRSLDSLTGILMPVDSLSLDNNFRTFAQEFRAGYTGQWRRLNLSFSVDGQPGQLSGTEDSKGDKYTYRYFTWLPQVQGAWKLTPIQTITLSYHGHSSLPSLEQVSPVTDLTNPQYPVTGNASLKPSYTHSVSLHYERSRLQPMQFSGVGGSIDYSVTTDPIIAITTHPKDSSQVIQAVSYTNAGQIAALYGDYHFTLPSFLHKRLRIVANGSISRSRNTTVTDQQQFTSLILNWTQALHLQLLVPDIIEMDMQGNYSVTHTSYNAPSQLPGTVRSAALILSGKQYFLKHGAVSGRLSQLYTSGVHGLQSTPASLMGSIQWQFLPHNKASIALTGNNLLNSRSAAAESVSASSITQMQTSYTGRYFLLTFLLKLERFR